VEVADKVTVNVADRVPALPSVTNTSLVLTDGNGRSSFRMIAQA
jgi:hypothetical protein